jgi:sugar lactone lactonase YvrE
VTKEVPQSGVTNNNWDVNSTTENYTRLNSAYATTLDWVGDLASASFVDSFSVSAQDTQPVGIAFNTDGTKMFIVGVAGQDVNEYDLSTGFDVSTASFVDSFSVSAQDTEPRGIAFNTAGTKMFVVGNTGDDVNEYTLSTAFDVSTASYSQNFSVASQDDTPIDIAFNTNGTKMFIVGETGRDVNEYSLSTAFDVSTASFVDSFSVAAQDIQPRSLAFNSSGTKMYVGGNVGDDINEYILSTGFDVSTATYSSNFSIASQEINIFGMTLNSTDDKMYIVGATGDAVFEYDFGKSLALGTGSFASADVGKTIEANDGVFVLTATDGSYIETTAPTSYDQVASGSWEMYGVVYNAADGDLELSGLPTYYSIAAASYIQSVLLSAQATNVQGCAFSTDGTKMYVVDYTTDTVYQYTLSNAFDVSSASYASKSFNVGSFESDALGITFKPDGTKMFIVGASGGSSGEVNEFSLSTAWDVSTSDSIRVLSVSAQEPTPAGIQFNDDGTKMFIVGYGNDTVQEFTLPSAYRVTGANHSASFTVSAQDTSPRAIAFNSDGTKMFVAGRSSGSVYQYSLSTAFSVSTASYDSISFDVSSQEGGLSGCVFNADGSKMYVSGGASDSVHEYSSSGVIGATGYQPVHTTNSIDTTYWTDINSMTADQAAGDGNVYYAISTDDRTTWTVIDNTEGERDIVRNNAGTWQYNSNATYALETWVNGATNTELATLAEAMEGASFGIGYDLSTASYDSVSFSVAAQESAATGMTFSSNGLKMFVVGSSGQEINEYNLSSAFDISTSVFSQNLSTVAQDNNPRNIVFNSDGTKMFIMGLQEKSVFEYTLSTGFDISSATYSQLFNVSSREATPTGLAFNNDGTKMFIIGADGDEVNEFALSTGFDISTSVFSQAFSVSSQDTSPRELIFNADGTKMFVVGASSDAVYQYSLSTGFDVSTASYDSISFSYSFESAGNNGISFNSDGTKLFLISEAGVVYQYSNGTTSYTNQMDKTQLDAVTDPNHIALGDDLDLAIVFNMTSGTTVPSSDGVAINYDANVLNKGAVLGTDYDFDAPAQNKVRITALAGNNLKVRVV